MVQLVDRQNYAKLRNFVDVDPGQLVQVHLVVVVAVVEAAAAVVVAVVVDAENVAVVEVDSVAPDLVDFARTADCCFEIAAAVDAATFAVENVVAAAVAVSVVGFVAQALQRWAIVAGIDPVASAVVDGGWELHCRFAVGCSIAFESDCGRVLARQNKKVKTHINRKPNIIRKAFLKLRKKSESLLLGGRPAFE